MKMNVADDVSPRSSDWTGVIQEVSWAVKQASRLGHLYGMLISHLLSSR
jgi:hypothetical protein